MSFPKLSKRDWIFILSFFVLIFTIYGQSLAGKFVFDDRNIIENEPILSSLSNIGQTIMHPFWSSDAGLYRPTTLLSYTFNYILLGHGPFGFHLINLLLYLGVCTFIYLFIKRFWKNDYLAYFTALLFLLLPIHTEVVANISGRTELLALFFSLLALLEFTTKKEINFWRLGLWIFLAIGSKEVAVATIPIILIIIFIKEQKINREVFYKYFRSLSGVLVGTIFYFFLRFFALGPQHFLGVKTSLIENPLLFTDTTHRIYTSLQILWMYISKNFWPVNLCSDYSFNQIPIASHFFNFGSILGLANLLLAIIFTIIYLRKKPIISLALSIFILSILPTSNILFPTGTIAGERLFFYPSLGVSLLVVFIFYQLFKIINKKTIKIVFLSIVILILSFYGIMAMRRQSVWFSEEKLFLSAEKCAPNSVLSQSNAGAIYLINGDLIKAQSKLELARSIKPIYSKGLNNLGLVYFRNGEYDKAEKLYFEALNQDFPYDGTYENLILLYLDKGDTVKAKHWLMFLYPGNENEVDALIKNYSPQPK